MNDWNEKKNAEQQQQQQIIIKIGYWMETMRIIEISRSCFGFMCKLFRFVATSDSVSLEISIEIWTFMEVKVCFDIWLNLFGNSFKSLFY